MKGGRSNDASQQQQSSTLLNDNDKLPGGRQTSILFRDTPTLKLEDLRSQLIRQEETIIFALIERAQFKSNPTVYKKDTIQAVKQKERVKGKSFLDFFLCETEKVHSLMRR